MAPIAPRPGSTPNSPAVREPQERAGRVAVISLAGDERRLHLADIGPEDNRICRRQTGFPIRRFFDDFDTDSILAIYWMARRKDGDRIAYAQIEAQYPTTQAIEEAGWSFDIIEDGAIDAEVVDDDDPLPSAGA